MMFVTGASGGYQMSLSELTLASSYTHHASRYLNGYGTGQQQLLFFLALGAVAIFWIVLAYWERITASFKPRQHNDDPLLYELCQAHQLTRGDLAFLDLFSTKINLKHPAMLFVSPETWVEYAPQFDSQKARMKKLYKILYGSELDQSQN